MDDGAVGFPNKPTYQAPVFQKLDKAIHWINHYPLDSGALLVSLTLMHHLGRSIFFPTPPPPGG